MRTRFVVMGSIMLLAVLLTLPAVSGSRAAEQASVSSPIGSSGESGGLKVLVSGRVIGAEPGWRVQATRSDGRVAAETIVEGEGRYTLPPLAPGIYHLVARKMDGERLPMSAGYTLRLGAESADQHVEHDVVVTSIAKQIPVVVQANGVITGVITAANTGLPVQSSISIYTEAGQYQTSVYNSAVTGIYTASLAPGSYKLWFYPFDTYVPEYYDNQSSLANANTVTVNDGAVTANINAVVDIGGWITGTVTAENGGTPLAYAGVYVYTSTTSLIPLYSPSSDVDGTYRIGQLPSGNYYLCFNPPYGENYLRECYNNQAALATAHAVAVTTGLTTTNINAALATGGEILGTVTDTGSGDPLANVNVVAYTSTTSVNFVASDSTDGNGDYVLNGLPTGNYYLKFDPAYGSEYVEEFYNDKSSLAVADPVAVTAGSATSGIDAALAIGGRITGRVTAAAGGSPIGNVAVRVYTSTISPYASQHLQTDAAGYYTATTLPTGNYYLEFDPPFATEYLREFYNDKLSLAQANPVAVTISLTTTNVNAALSTGGRIAGRVTAVVGGGAIAGIGVYVYTSTTSSIYSFYAGTDAGGYYTVTKLTTGTYYLHFNPSPSYLPEYYNDKPNLASADPVVASVGSTTGNINAALSSPGSIAGMITAADGGAPLQNVYVNLYLRDNCDEISWVKSAYSNAAGNYTLSNVAPGTYVVYFDTRIGVKSYLPEYYNDKTESWLADPITVTVGQAVTNINAVLQRGGYITGQVTAADGGAPLPGVNVTAYDSQGSDQDVATTDANGVYTTTALYTGAYRLGIYPNNGGVSAAYLSEYYNNKATTDTADPINVTIGNVVSNINVVLDRGGRISGRVTGNANTPLAHVYVRVFDSLNTSPAYAYTDANGYYTTTGLIAGTFRLYFNTQYASGDADDYAGEYYNDKATLASADPVTVTGTAMTSNINVTLALGGRINGTITAQGSGQPLLDAHICVLGSDNRCIGSVYSDEQGQYTSSALASGTYRVRFYDSWEYNAATCSYTRYYGLYYNQQPTLAAADPVTVTAPDTRHSVDAVLSTTPSGLTNKVYLPLMRK